MPGLSGYHTVKACTALLPIHCWSRTFLHRAGECAVANDRSGEMTAYKYRASDVAAQPSTA